MKFTIFHRRRAMAAAAISLLLCVAVAATGCSIGRGGDGKESPTMPDTASPESSTPSPAPPDESSGSIPTNSPSPSQAPDDPIASRVAAMSLEDKIGQLIFAGVDGTKMTDRMRRLIEEQRVGGIILFKDNITSAAQTTALLNGLKAANAAAANPAPLLIGIDQEGGRVNRLPKTYAPFPTNAEVGAIKDPALAEREGELLGRAVGTLGFNMNFAPVLDVNSNPDNPVIGDRSYASDPEVVAELGLASSQGMRGTGVIPVVKHFPGHGDTSVDSHVDLPVVKRPVDELRKLEWRPFERAIQDGADAVMVAHILYTALDPDRPSSLSEPIITGLLRRDLGFDGVVITDDLTMGAIADGYGLAEAAELSIAAGADIALVAHKYDNAAAVFDGLLGAVRAGRLTEAQIDTSVYRILHLKAKYELTDEPLKAPAQADLDALNADIRELSQEVER